MHALIYLPLLALGLPALAGAAPDDASWTTEFAVEKDDLSSTGPNPYFILEPGAKEYKLYAPGIGLIQDGSLKLVKYGKAN